MAIERSSEPASSPARRKLLGKIPGDQGHETIVARLAFGLSLMVLLLLAVVRNDLLEDWRASLPADTPNFFMINIPAVDTQDFVQFVEKQGLPTPQLFPMIRARLTPRRHRFKSEACNHLKLLFRAAA